MQWYEDSRICAQLPLPLKCYSAYCRRMLDQPTGMVKGGSFLLRNLQKYRHLWGAADRQSLQVDGVTIVLDPYSEVASFALNELIASSDELRIMRLALSPGDTFLDVGANHGAFALMACSLVGPEGAVYAFEPQPELAGLLQACFQANSFWNAGVHQVALSDHAGTTTFYIPVHSGCAGVYRDFSGKGAHRELAVPLVTLDEHIKTLHAPAKLFIKLDVEGSELPFLRGAQDTLRERRPLILMEINPDSAAAAGYKVADLIAQLRELGYSRFAEMKDYPESHPFEHLTAARMNDFHDIVVVP